MHAEGKIRCSNRTVWTAKAKKIGTNMIYDNAMKSVAYRNHSYNHGESSTDVMNAENDTQMFHH